MARRMTLWPQLVCAELGAQGVAQVCVATALQHRLAHSWSIFFSSNFELSNSDLNSTGSRLGAKSVAHMCVAAALQRCLSYLLPNFSLHSTRNLRNGSTTPIAVLATECLLDAAGFWFAVPLQLPPTSPLEGGFFVE